MGGMRSEVWQRQKMAVGLCSQCGEGRVKVNPQTGRVFWRCDECKVRQADRRVEREFERVKALAGAVFVIDVNAEAVRLMVLGLVVYLALTWSTRWLLRRLGSWQLMNWLGWK